MFDKNYWNNRYIKKETGWDIGYASPPIVSYVDTLKDRSLSILIPGAGNAYEAEYLFNQGFNNVTIVDIAEEAINSFSKRVPQFPRQYLINEDFFLHNGYYDLILEQTFFCALPPSLRTAYAQKMHTLLKSKGILAGLLFHAELYQDHPPYGGTKMEYTNYFSPYFEFHSFDIATNSIPPRQGKELFIKLEKKN